MSDPLGEALAEYEWVDGQAQDPYDVIGEHWRLVLAAARNWQALSNPSNELVERVAQVLHDNDEAYAPPYWSDCTDGMKRWYRRQARAVVDALTVTAEP